MRIQTKETLKLAREKFPHGGKIALTIYPDEESFNALRNPDGMTFPEHREIVSETSAALEAEGYKVSLVSITKSEYLKWLGDDLNTTTTRAQFVALKIEGTLEEFGNFSEVQKRLRSSGSSCI